MGELNILAASLEKKGVLIAIDSCMNIKEEFTSQAQIILKSIRRWYEEDPEATKVDPELLKNSVMRENKRHAEKLGLFIDKIAGIEVSAINVQKEIINTKADKIMQDLGARMLNFEPYETMTEELRILEELHNNHELWERNLSTHEYEVYTNEDFSSLLGTALKEEKVPLFPTKINDHLGGGVWRKASIVVFGRPDMGKTTFMVNLTCGFLNQGLKVLYIANEDPATQLLIRHVQCFLKITKPEVEGDLDGKIEQCRTLGLENLVLVETPSGTMHHLDNLVRDNKPDILVVDQLRNMRGLHDSRVLQLEDTQRGIRELGKKYDCVTIGVTQAGASADDKPVLGMGDIDFSKTGIAGGCDLMIGIGANSGMMQQGIRFLSFPKNKINGTKDPIDVQFRTDIARVH
jgi:archaellum biogenesis ATPase FlaH